MVALIGEGQEIHLGEESGLAPWNDFIIGDAETCGRRNGLIYRRYNTETDVRRKYMLRSGN